MIIESILYILKSIKRQIKTALNFRENVKEKAYAAVAKKAALKTQEARFNAYNKRNTNLQSLDVELNSDPSKRGYSVHEILPYDADFK